MTIAPATLAQTYTQSMLPTAKTHSNTRAWETAQDFEAQFMSSMAQTMFEGIKTDDTFGGGPGEDTFRSMLVSQYGQEMSKAGGFGIADQIYGEILKMQEQSQ
ncbi:MAG: rod-binding protein [Parvibaculum sp.]|nr:rod-binding protein [Parvibaculum sp.]|tara:strand:- start:2879 stop:3187 length:309 start_codon:yes stop_codon:yes gene_type:complete